MKNLALLSLILFAQAAQAYEPKTVEIKCGQGSQIIRLTGPSEGVDHLNGFLLRAYNGAGLTCQRYGWSRLVGNGIPLVCAGVWDHSHSEGDKIVARVVRVEIRREESGALRASYFENWNNGEEKVDLACESTISSDT